MEPNEYDIEKETSASREMLEDRIPARLNLIYRMLEENRHGYEPWRSSLTFDLVESVKRNCGELLETFGKDRLQAAAWVARNLLELWVWVGYCGVSRETAWRFHEDALRDVKGLTELHDKIFDAMGMDNEIATIASQRIRNVASEKLGLEDIDSHFLAVANAAKTEGVRVGDRFGALYRYFIEVRASHRGPCAWHRASGRSLPAFASDHHHAGRVLRRAEHHGGRGAAWNSTGVRVRRALRRGESTYNLAGVRPWEKPDYHVESGPITGGAELDSSLGVFPVIESSASALRRVVPPTATLLPET